MPGRGNHQYFCSPFSSGLVPCLLGSIQGCTHAHGPHTHLHAVHTCAPMHTHAPTHSPQTPKYSLHTCTRIVHTCAPMHMCAPTQSTHTHAQSTHVHPHSPHACTHTHSPQVSSLFLCDAVCPPPRMSLDRGLPQPSPASLEDKTLPAGDGSAPASRLTRRLCWPEEATLTPSQLDCALQLHLDHVPHACRHSSHSRVTVLAAGGVSEAPATCVSRGPSWSIRTCSHLGGISNLTTSECFQTTFQLASGSDPAITESPVKAM